jgi:predicted Rossmann fold nucleotide-binding protein DprA/Smf involved in DNA uptake
MNSQTLDAETQVTLLLCSAFGESAAGDSKALSLGEYNRLCAWLQGCGQQLSGLLQLDAESELLDTISTGINKERLVALLDRRSELETVEPRWQEQGVWVLARTSSGYPRLLSERLRNHAPPLLFGIGSQAALNAGGLAIVGSRDADADALQFTRSIATECANLGLSVVSGAARGVDREAMSAALDAGGMALGVLADGLGREAASGKHDELLERRQLTLVSPYHPDVGFSIGNAMGRNKCIYAFADWSLVVSATANTGGTWAGAVENLKRGWTPLLVRDGDNVPDGNRQLLKMGAFALPESSIQQPSSLLEILNSCNIPDRGSESPQSDLFGPAL